MITAQFTAIDAGKTKLDEEELDDEEADLKSEEVSSVQADLNYTHIYF